MEGITIRPGEISISSVTKLINLPDVKIYELALNSKYPGLVNYTHSSSGATLLMLAGERTHPLDETRRGLPTFVDFVLPGYEEGLDWQILVDSGRYTMRVVLFRADLIVYEGDTVNADELIVTT